MENVKGFSSKPIINSVTGDVISFKILTDPEYQASNDTVDVYVNSNKIGRTSGQFMSPGSFSPDNKYFYFITNSNMGCASRCRSSSLWVIDIKEKTVASVLFPKESDYKRFFLDSTQMNSRLIESCSWHDNGSLDFTLYYSAFSVNKDEYNYYRISPVEVFRYSIAENKLSLISSLP